MTQLLNQADNPQDDQVDSLVVARFVVPLGVLLVVVDEREHIG